MFSFIWFGFEGFFVWLVGLLFLFFLFSFVSLGFLFAFLLFSLFLMRDTAAKAKEKKKNTPIILRFLSGFEPINFIFLRYLKCIQCRNNSTVLLTV